MLYYERLWIEKMFKCIIQYVKKINTYLVRIMDIQQKFFNFVIYLNKMHYTIINAQFFF